MKKLISMIIASTMVFSCASVLLMQSVFAAGSTLPQKSGTTCIDKEASDGITGSAVVIQNTGSAPQSTGDLGALLPRSGLFSQPPEIEDSGKLDFAMPVEPIPEMLAAPFALPSGIPPAVGDDKMFEITNPITYVSTNESFKLLKDGTNCLIWAKDSKITTGMAESIAIEFDNSYSTLKSNFGEFLGTEVSNKVNVLLYDIQDGNNPSAYIAGFFYAEDFKNANQAPIIHIDTYPAMYRSTTSTPRVSNAYSTIVHEMQHLINFSNSHSKQVLPMDSWLNEALSMAAEEMIYPNSSIPSRLWTYNTDYSSSITNGKSLLSFDNSLESYALSCLFSAYLKSQTDSAVFSRIISNYINNDGNVADAITNALASSVLDGFTFNDVLSAYKIALARNDQTGIYGFNGDAALAGINPHIYSGGSMLLPPGGSITVIPASGTFIPSGNGPDIKFMGISELTGAPVITNKPIDMVVGETYTLTGTGDAPLTWSSSDALVATVDSSGMITALAEGNTTITLSNDQSSNTFVLTVKGKSISIKPFVTTIMIGSSVTLEAITRPASNTVVWSSSDTSIATIDVSGNLTGKASGTTTVTATCDGLTASVGIKVIPVTGYPGLEIDSVTKEIDVVDDIGMHTLSTIVNTSAAGFDAGLAGWTVNLKTPVTLVNHVPIGPYGVEFKGTFNGNNQNITFVSADVTNNYIGVFGVNMGRINDMNITVTGTVGDDDKSCVGAVAGSNRGTISNSIVCIAKTGVLVGKNDVGGVAGFNFNVLLNSHVTNYNIIKSVASPCGGVVGQNRGYNEGEIGIIHTATVYNDGIIQSNDDVGGVVGLNNSWKEHAALVTGNMNVTIAKNGKIFCTNFGTASVGGVVGYNYGSTFFTQSGVGKRDPWQPDMYINLRIDGNISTASGSSGGVIGEASFGMPEQLIPYVSVTLGPESNVTNASAGMSGLILSDPYTNGKQKFVYAVPYGSPYHAFPTIVPADQGVKRIEYPKDGNPVDTIKILDPDQNAPTKVINSAGASAPDGIFIKKDLLINPSAKPLLMQSAFDAEIFDIDIANQTVQSRYLTEKNYYDFNMLADGIPIVVPAYLDVRGKLAPPAMTLDIAGAKVKLTEEEATADPAYGKQDITITAKNGRITSWDIIKDGVPYMSSISMSQNTDLLKKFSVSDRGLYVITATGTPLDAAAAQITQTKYLRIGGIPAITLDGQHLSGLPTENWTNLKDSQPTAGLELVTAEAHATTVESLAVTKGAVPYTLFTEDFTLNTAAKKTFQLMETGRYMITAKGKDIAIPAVKYVNIDVDRPLPPIVDTANFNGKDIGITLPTESMDQSPIHAEYKVDDGAFSGVMGNSVPLAGDRITMRTVDLAGNISDEIVIDLCTVTVTPEPANGGTVTGGGSYLLVGRDVNGTIVYDNDVFATIKATPASGYTFEKWTDGTDEYNTATYVFKVTGDVDFIAHFKQTPIDIPDPIPPEPTPSDPIPPSTVYPSGDDYVKLEYIPKTGGTVSGKELQYIRRYTDGEAVTAVADPGYRFVTWSDGVKTPRRQDLKVAQDIKVFALFELIPKEKPVAPPNVVRPPKTGSINWTPLLLSIMVTSLGTLIFSSIKLARHKRKTWSCT